MTLRWRAASSMACADLHRGQARFLVDELAMRKLRFDNVDLFHIVEPRWPGAGAQAHDAADDLGEPLKHHKCARDRNDRFEVVDGRTLRRHGRVLPDAPGVGGIAVARVDEPEDARDKEEKIQREIERRLGARFQVDVDEVGAHMAGERQRVGAAHHEQRAVEHVVQIEDPRRRRVQDVALEHLDGNHEGQPTISQANALPDQ